MKFKKTFWMNVLLSIPFIPISFSFFYSNGMELITSPLTYTSAFGLATLYLFFVAPLVPTVSAYTFNTNKKVTLANVLNVLQLLFIVAIAVYVYTGPITMEKKNMSLALVLYFFVFVIPSIINIRALAKMENK